MFPALALGIKPMKFDVKGNKLIEIICINHAIRNIRLKATYAYFTVKFIARGVITCFTTCLSRI